MKYNLININQEEYRDKEPMEEQNQENENRHMKPIQPHLKVIVALLLAVTWFLVTKGKPPRTDLLEGLSHIQTSTEEVFETTIAIEKKVFTKRIIQESKGYWKYIPYVNQPRWVDLEITLTTHIGYDIKNGDNVEIGMTSEGRPFIQIYEPTVIRKHWIASIAEKSSDNLFNKWDIEEYKKKEEEILGAIAEAESQNVLEQFKNDPSKMSQLAHRLDQKLLMKESLFSSPLKLLESLNGIFDEAIKNLLFPYKRSTHWKSSKVENKTYEQPQASAKKQKRSKQKMIDYTPQQKKMRENMKNQLQL